MNFLQLTNEENRILELALNEEIEESTFYELVENLNVAIKEKGETYIKLLDNFKFNIESAKNFKKELDSRIKAMEKTKEKIENYLKFSMQNAGLKKIQTNLGTITYYDGRDSVDVINDIEIPKQFIKIVQEEKIDKRAILEHYKNTGEIVSGIDIVQTPYIVIR